MRWLDGINGQEFEQTPGDSEGQGSLAAAVQGFQQLDMTQLPKNNCSFRDHLLSFYFCVIVGNQPILSKE